VIKSFADKETEKLFQRWYSQKLSQTMQHTARRKLEILDAADEVEIVDYH
jgi:proteic killer suppression protein